MKYPMRVSYLLVTVTILWTLGSCTSNGSVDVPAAARPRTIDSVMAEQDDLFGREVSVRGYLALDFENTNIYQSKNDFERNSRRCITIAIDDFVQQAGPKHNHQFVLVRGTLQKDYVKNDEMCLSCCTDYAVVPNSITPSH